MLLSKRAWRRVCSGGATRRDSLINTLYAVYRRGGVDALVAEYQRLGRDERERLFFDGVEAVRRPARSLG